MQDKYEINKEVIEDLSRKLEELENPFEYWKKRLASESLTLIEETVKKELYSDKRVMDIMMGEAEAEPERIKDKGRSLDKRIEQTRTACYDTGKPHRKEIASIEKELKESRSEETPYKELEEKLDTLKKEVDRYCSKYGG